jgi:hypothetical protein
MRVDDPPDDDVKLNDTCDECEYKIPDAEEGSICNKYHASWCSLYSPENE